MKYEHGALVEWQGKSEILGQKYVSLLFCPPHIPYQLPLRSSKRASAVRGQRLTASASRYVKRNTFIRIIHYLREVHEMNTQWGQLSICLSARYHSRNHKATFSQTKIIRILTRNSSWTTWLLKMGPIICPVTSVTNYHKMLRKNSRRAQIPFKAFYVTRDIWIQTRKYSFDVCATSVVQQ